MMHYKRCGIWYTTHASLQATLVYIEGLTPTDQLPKDTAATLVQLLLVDGQLFVRDRLLVEDVKPVLNWVNFCFVNLVRGVRRT